MPVYKQKIKHPWYSKKGYLHFDYALDLRQATRYVSDERNIINHKFSPFIHYIKSSRKVKRNKDQEKAWREAGKPSHLKPKKLFHKLKERHIFYASHIDGYIYSYYASIIQDVYKRYLHENGLSQTVIAYRSVRKNKTKYSNIHFARDAFSFLERNADLNVSCYDLSKFFDKLDVAVLKTNWAKVLGVDVLPSDHEVLHRQLTNFTFVEETDLVDAFGDRFLENPRQHGFDTLSGGSKKNRICNYKELRELHSQFKKVGKRLIQRKDKLDITGIAQGSAISGLLANIFMLEFDKVVKDMIKGMGGLYLRYSDDIFVAYPQTISHEEMYKIIADILLTSCGSSVTINPDKTENAVVKKENGKLRVLDASGVEPTRIQYLGFHLSSNGVHIRNSSISKDRGKTVEAIAAAHRRKQYGKIDTKSVYKSKSHRKVTDWNPMSEKGFMCYASRSSKIFDNPKTLEKQLRKSDRFVRRAIERRRERVKREREATKNRQSNN